MEPTGSQIFVAGGEGPVPGTVNELETDPTNVLIQADHLQAYQ